MSTSEKKMKLVEDSPFPTKQGKVYSISNSQHHSKVFVATDAGIKLYQLDSNTPLWEESAENIQKKGGIQLKQIREIFYTGSKVIISTAASIIEITTDASKTYKVIPFGGFYKKGGGPKTHVALLKSAFGMPVAFGVEVDPEEEIVQGAFEKFKMLEDTIPEIVPFENIKQGTQVYKSSHVEAIDFDKTGTPDFLVRSVADARILKADGTVKATLKNLPRPFTPMGDNEVVLYGKITGNKGGKYGNFLIRNYKGLYLYECDANLNCKVLNYNPMFSDVQGWDNPALINTVHLEDVNGDGLDELVFTSPNGLQVLTFNTQFNEWVPIIDNNDFEIADRRSRVVGTAKVNSQARIITKDPTDKIKVWKITPKNDEIYIPELNEQDVPFRRNELAKKAATSTLKIGSETTPIEMSLKDTIDYASLVKNSVDVTTGRLRFQIPLMDTVSRLFNFMTLSYDSGSTDSFTVGQGWSLPEQYILLDDQGSVFPTDHRYLMVAQEMIFELFLVGTDKTNPKKWLFSFTNPASRTNKDSTGEVVVTYDTEKEIWIIPKKDVNYVYGSEDATVYDLTWKNYRGRGNSATNLIRTPRMWNLAQINDANGKTVLNLHYLNIQEEPSVYGQPPSAGGLKLTRQIYLESAEDIYGNKLKLNYKDKDSGEYDLEKQMVKDGNLEKYSFQGKFLDEYTLSGSKYTQSINFEYELLDNVRFLKKIIQSGHTVLEFTYDENDMLADLKVPGVMDVTHLHSLGKGKPKHTGTIMPLQFGSFPKFQHLPDSLMVSYLTQGDKRLQLFMYSPDGKVLQTDLSDKFKGGNWNDYQVIVSENLMTITGVLDNEKELYFLSKNKGGEWAFPPTNTKGVKLPKDTIVKSGRDYVVYDTPGTAKATLVYFENNGVKQRIFSDIEVDANNEVMIATSFNWFVLGGKKSQVWYRKQDNEWDGGTIDTEDYQLGDIHYTRETLSKFPDLSEEKKKSMLRSFKESSLIIQDNMIIKTQVALQSAYGMSSDIQMVQLNEKFGVAQVIHSDALTQMLSKPILSISHAYDDSTLLYVDDGTGKFKIEINPPNEKYNKIDTLIRWEKFYPVVRDNKIYFGETVFFYDGTEVKSKSANEVQKAEQSSGPNRLTDALTLEQDGSSFKLMENGKPITLSCDQIALLHAYLPSYLTCQGSDGLDVAFLNQWGQVGFQNKYADELPTQFSNNRMLISVKKTLDKEKNTIFVLRTMEPIVKTHVVEVQTVTLKDSSATERKTSYMYYDPKSAGTTAIFGKSTVKPGDNIESYGSIVYENPHDPEKKALMKYFNDANKLIYVEDRSSPNESGSTGIATNAKLKQATITDMEGQVEIMQAFPYQQAADEVDFYGFEVYENDLKKRSYPRNGVESCKFSRTGKNCLRLNGQEGYSAFYSPETQDKAYKVLTWVRTSDVTLEAVTPISKALIYDGSNHLCTILSTVKIVDRVGGWVLLETKIDLPLLRKLSSQQVPKSIIVHDQAGLKKVTPNSHFGIGVQISPNGEVIDVDHVYFAPYHMDTTVYVYDPALWKLTNEISSTGLIKSHIYDEFNNELCTVNEDNQVDSFSSFSILADRIGVAETKPLSIIEVSGVNGYYETFSPESFVNMWKVDTSKEWTLSPGMLRHNGSGDIIITNTNINSNSVAIRFRYALDNPQSQININNVVYINSGLLSYGTKMWSIDNDGEIIVISDGGRLFVLIGGNVVIDNQDAKDFVKSPVSISMLGSGSIQDLVLLRDPSIEITHINALGETIQKVHVIENGSAIVRGFQLDGIGRKVKENFPEKITPEIGTTLLDFDAKKLPKKNKKHRKVVYFEDPTNEIKHVTVMNGSGKDNSGTVKNYLRDFDPQDFPAFLTKAYPLTDLSQYRYQVEQKPGLIRDVIIYNTSRQKVARYTYSQTDKENGVLSTYLYNEKGQQRAVIPPEAYAEEFDREDILKPTPEQLKQGTVMSYDSNGQIKTIKSCDAGKRENFFNAAGNVKFQVTYDTTPKNPAPTSIIYYNYDNLHRVESTGYVKNPETKNAAFFNDNLNKMNIPDAVEFQRFEYVNEGASPYFSTRVQRVITQKSAGEDYPHVEEVVANINNKVVSNRVYLPTKSNKMRTLEVTQRFRNMDSVAEIEYPFEYKKFPLKVKYVHDKLDRIESIKVNQNVLVRFEYDAEGLITRQVFSPGSKSEFDRTYKFNELGLYKEISDKFLTEEIEYTARKTGKFTIIDGSIASTKFLAKWQELSDQTSQLLTEEQFQRKSKLPKYVSTLCHKALRTTGVIDDSFQQTKLFSTVYNPEVPFICAAKSDVINKALGKESFQKMYGHKYEFSYNNELQSAKYYVGNQSKFEYPTLNQEEFAKHPEPRTVWQKLIWNDFILEFYNRLESSKPFGKRGPETVLNPHLVEDLLKAKELLQDPTIPDHIFLRPLEDFILYSYIQNQGKIPSETELQNWFQFPSFASAVHKALQKRDPIHPFLLKHFEGEYLYTGLSILHGHFFLNAVPSEFDVEAYAGSLNGNHKHFRTGYQQYKLDYEEGTNKIKSIKAMDDSTGVTKTYAVKHDSQGNIIQAQHKNIEQIKYHPVLNKASEIVMSDGRIIKYSYNVRSDRISKRVYSKNNELLIEVSYVRDDKGRSLVEREVLHMDGGKEPLVTVTAYVYAEKGLVGFFRNDNYYNVLKDHEGSVRLVEKNGEIVAAYDYYPYGGLMRSFETDADSQISYRYTGHEYDAETGLYNAVARLYDPDIGRFYQMDPKAQYFSSYKYSGNSPVSMVDPDGEFAMFIATVVSGAVGAYLGAAAANDAWLPWQWDFSNKNTYIGLAEGALWGALIPVGFSGSVGALAVYTSKLTSIGLVAATGVAAAYWDGYRRAGTLDFTTWNYTDPTLYFNMFTGFADVGIVGDVVALRKVPKLIQFFKGLSTFKKIGYVGAATSMFTFETYIAAGNHDFNLMDPDTIKDMLNGIITMPFDARSILRNTKTIRQPYNSAKALAKRAAKGHVNDKNLKKTLNQIGDIFVDGGAATKNTIKATSFAVAFSKTKNIDSWLNPSGTTPTLNAAGSKMYVNQVSPKWSPESVEERRWQTAQYAGVMQSGSSVKSNRNVTPAPQWDDFVAGNQKVTPVLNSRAKEALDQFNKIRSKLESGLRDPYGLVNEATVKILLNFIQNRLENGQPFILDLGKIVKNFAAEYFNMWTKKLVKLSEDNKKGTLTETQKTELTSLVNLWKSVRTVYQFEKVYWESNQIGSQLENLNNLVSSVPFVVPYTTKVSSQCAAASRSNYYKPGNFLYTDSVEFVYSEPYPDCFLCPEITTNIFTKSLTESNILAQNQNLTSGLFYQPPPCAEEKIQRKRRATDSVFQKVGDCVSYLNTTTSAMISTLKEGIFNKTETFTPDYSMANMSSTLLLVDTCLRKLTGEKYKSVGKGEMTLNKAQEMAMKIVSDVETVLKEEILDDNKEFFNDIDFAGLQCEVFKAIVEDRKSKVLDIIWNSMKGSMEKLSATETANFKEYFNNNCQETKNM